MERMGSSLPNNLHPFLLKEPQSGDSRYRLRPIARSATVEYEDHRESRGMFPPPPRPPECPWDVTHSSIPHGSPGSETNPTSVPPTLPDYNNQYSFHQGRTSWQNGEAGPSSRNGHHPDQSWHSDTNVATQPTIYGPECTRRSLPDLASILSTDTEHIQVDVWDGQEVEGRGFPERGGTVSTQMTPDYSQLGHSRNLRYQSLHSDHGPVGDPFRSNLVEDEDMEVASSTGSGINIAPSPYAAGPSISVKKEPSENSVSMRPRQEPDCDEGNSKKKNLIRPKALVACTFCRVRKLRCSSETPLCSNCRDREKDVCIYTAPRTRGPGKANKGTRQKNTRGKGKGGGGPSYYTGPPSELSHVRVGGREDPELL